ncbi:hypothetical protein [Rhodothermus profundi]|uniref:Cytochrome C and Quinol oxidase polypeptide I n=1 Tax=Rhodothermus profundi TaxID=633813 RepID=A0A1M6UHW5_9BACT|nr:hypothetical protein [Rhodothermus profundi]SHK68834.1 hypothetical protein SAMN04488087_1715 [Rhodothermus profundi]
MPSVSCWLIRLALGHLLLGFTMGSWLLVHKTGWLPAWPGLRLMHVELVLLGFMVLFAVSVAWWILPRRGGVRPSDQGAWVAGGILVGGVWLVGIGAVSMMQGVQVVGRTMELIAVVLWARLLWPRIRVAQQRRGA